LKKILIICILFVSALNSYSQLNTDRILQIGQNALYYDDFVLSIQYFNQIIKAKPYLAEPYMYRAIAKIQLGDYTGAENDASLAIERNPFLAHAYYTRGFANVKLGKYKDAEKDISMALEYNPGSQDYLRLRTEARDKSENYPLAIEDLKQLLKMNRKDHGLYYEIGRIYLQMKDTVSAEKSFHDMIFADSSSYAGWSALGLLKMQKNERDSALFYYNKSIAHKSTYSGDYINRGIINNQKNNFRQALLDYDNAIKYDSTQYLGYYNRALLRSYLGDNNNAITDLNKVIAMDSAIYEAIWKRANLQSSIGKYKNAIADFNIILNKYPYFLPAIYGVAEAEDALGNIKEAFRHRQLAKNIEQNKEYYRQKSKKELTANNISETKIEEKGGKKNKRLENLFAEQTNDSIKRNQNVIRGEIQNQMVEIQAEADFEFSYVTLVDPLRRTNLFNASIMDFNKKKVIPSELRISNIKVPHNKEFMQLHIFIMGEVSRKIANDPNNPDYYFCRSIESISSYDYNGAMDDLNKTIDIDPNYTLAYFSRAFLNFKMYYNHMFDQDKPLEYTDELTGKKVTFKLNTNAQINLQSIIKDYNKVIELQPDFSFAYYNKANLMITQKDYKSALALYSKAIEIDTDFAEAYFNRGLTWLFIGNDAKGLEDLGKAGELGIYSSYNLMKRFGK
jgi:tetratricopeptide (TPR) repeat protein